MAAGIISKPGTGRGPCLHCNHKDCAQLRQLAQQRCRLCGMKINYGRRFYEDPDPEGVDVQEGHPVEKPLVHATCLEDAEEREARAGKPAEGAPTPVATSKSRQRGPSARHFAELEGMAWRP
jgi:hypothetical protein